MTKYLSIQDDNHKNFEPTIFYASQKKLEDIINKNCSIFIVFYTYYFIYFI